MYPNQAQRLLVPAIAASQFAGPFMVSGVAVALPSLGAELHAGATALSLVETLFLAASVALLLPLGRLCDAADKVAIYKTGIVAFAASSILTGPLAPTAAEATPCTNRSARSTGIDVARPVRIEDTAKATMPVL